MDSIRLFGPLRIRSSTTRHDTMVSGTPNVSTVAAMTSRMETRTRRRISSPIDTGSVDSCGDRESPHSVRLEAEADPTNGRDPLISPVTAVGIRPGDLAPQPGHVHVQGLRGFHRRVVPHLGQDLLARDDLAGPAHHHSEQLELLVRQGDLDPVHLDPPGPGLHPNPA